MSNYRRDDRTYQCSYCSQRCASVEILMAHERDCPTRRVREIEWKEERRKYIARYTHTKRHKETIHGEGEAAAQNAQSRKGWEE